jgi:GNAT superfamily N-acetyltransferase
MPAATLRPATAADYDAYVALVAELGIPDPVPGRDRFVEAILPRVTVACDAAGEVVGYATWRPYGATAHLVNIAVLPRVRGQRIGEQLMAAVRAQAIAAGCTRWYLNVKRDNAAAIRLYERCGLRVAFAAAALEIPWTVADALPRTPGVTGDLVAPDEDAAIGARFGHTADRMTWLRTAGRRTMVVARAAADSVVGFAAFDPHHPGATPFTVASPDHAGDLLAACRPYALHDRFAFIRITAEDDAALTALLVAAGAIVQFEMFQLAAPLVP